LACGGDRAGKPVERVADETGRDGCWLARWLRHRGIECRVIHPTPSGDHLGVAVSREGRRAKTDRLDAAPLMRAFAGWLRDEPEPCRPARPAGRARFPDRRDRRLTIERGHPDAGRGGRATSEP
jgi:transposase